MSKKKIIAIVTIIVLLFAAGISVGVFLYGRGETSAADGSQVQGTTDSNQPNNGTQQPTEGTQTGDGDEQQGNVDSENQTTEHVAGDEVITPDEGNVDNETVDNDNIAGNAGNTGNAGVTTGTNVNDVGETTITRVEEQEKLVSEALKKLQ